MSENILNVIAKEPKFRADQLCKAWFDVNISGYDKITTYPKELREKLKKFSWLSVEPAVIEKSKIDGTVKALLKLHDGLFIETVLLGRDKKTETGGIRHTICISSQVGCAMGCVFCATGKLGFARNLEAIEIIDQFRFWQNYLAKNKMGGVDNIVVMGQGEPLLNYENIKTAFSIILKNTDIGQSKITISTVGIKNGMEKILEDKDFPPVRIAISLHSAIEKTRKQIVPSHEAGFLNFLPKWADEYHKIFGSRAHFISLEYVMLRDINDNDEHLKALIHLAHKLGNMRVNLIPWNELPFSLTTKIKLIGSKEETIKYWQKKMTDSGIICTIRHSQGLDISAACGQLVARK